PASEAASSSPWRQNASRSTSPTRSLQRTSASCRTTTSRKRCSECLACRSRARTARDSSSRCAAWARASRVLLDGMPISAASEGSVDQQARNREFDFDLLPSEIFSKLEVSKTPQASLVEGGLSGTVNLHTPRPFDYPGFTASYQLQGAYQETSEEIDPRASFLISNTWGNRFGALVSFSMSERTYRTDGWNSQGWTSGLVPGNPPDPGYAKGFDWNLPSVFADPANQAPDFINESGLTNAELANAQVPRLGRPEVQVGGRDRVGGTLALQWLATDTLSFNLDVLYSKLEADFDRYTNNLLVRNTGVGTNT